MNRAVLIDNYDSFSYNLKALVEKEFEILNVFRNDEVEPSDLLDYDVIFLSPGPSTPKEAGRLLEIIDFLKDKRPIFGVCLGLQAIGEVFGGKLELMKKPLHGISKAVIHDVDPLFLNIPSGFRAARYHSWVVSDKDLPEELKVIARDDEDMIMAIKHKDLPVYGVQFHPESVLTTTGLQMIQNFLNQVKIKNNESITR